MEMQIPDLTYSTAALAALGMFAIAYAFVIAEEFTHLRKSKPVVVAAGVLWLLVALAWQKAGLHGADEAATSQSRRIRRTAAIPAGRDDIREHPGRAPCLRRTAQRTGGAQVFLPHDVLADRRDHLCSLADPRQSHHRAGHGRGRAGGRPRRCRASSPRPASTSSWPPMPAAHSVHSATSRR